MGNDYSIKSLTLSFCNSFFRNLQIEGTITNCNRNRSLINLYLVIPIGPILKQKTHTNYTTFRNNRTRNAHSITFHKPYKIVIVREHSHTLKKVYIVHKYIDKTHCQMSVNKCAPADQGICAFWHYCFSHIYIYIYVYN